MTRAVLDLLKAGHLRLILSISNVKCTIHTVHCTISILWNFLNFTSAV